MYIYVYICIFFFIYVHIAGAGRLMGLCWVWGVAVLCCVSCASCPAPRVPAACCVWPSRNMCLLNQKSKGAVVM